MTFHGNLLLVDQGWFDLAASRKGTGVSGHISLASHEKRNTLFQSAASVNPETFILKRAFIAFLENPGKDKKDNFTLNCHTGHEPHAIHIR